MPGKSLSVFLPSYNEAQNLPLTVSKTIEVLKKLDLKWEVLIINDGSTDNTKEVSENLAKKFPNIRIINQENGGYGTALRSGFKNAKYDWIVYTDADGQFDFSQVNKFLEKTETSDYIIGFRIKRNDPPQRLFFAKGWAISVFILFGVWVKDIDCGFKMIKREVLDSIGQLQSTRGAMINAELLIKIKKRGFKITQVGVNHYPRLKGSPTGASISVIVKSYFDLIKLWIKLF